MTSKIVKESNARKSYLNNAVKLDSPTCVASNVSLLERYYSYYTLLSVIALDVYVGKLFFSSYSSFTLAH